MTGHEASRKIALVGTSCVGKTSILESYHKRFGDDHTIAIVEEAAREYFIQNPEIPIIERFGFEPQSAIQDLAKRKEQEAHDSGAKSILTDRSVTDAAAYVLGHGDREGSKRLISRVKFWLPTYHIIFLLDPDGVPYAQDETRQEALDVRLKNHEAFLELYEDEGIRFELLSGTLDQRIKRVDEVVLFKR